MQRLQALLWVDDYPENNAFEVDALKRNGVEVIPAATNSDALRSVKAGRPLDVIITDMGREGEGDDAGLELLKGLYDLGVSTPVSLDAGHRVRERARGRAHARSGTETRCDQRHLFRHRVVRPALPARTALAPGQEGLAASRSQQS
jgi:CheY-like chemotaxis protein